MARYDVYDNPVESGLLLDVQSDILADYSTRVVVPLVPKSGDDAAYRLNPVFEIGEREWVMYTQHLSAVPGAALKNKIANMTPEHDRIVAALDMLFHGF
ncbi:MAG: CcdB family protein [Salaquimonas sp.]|nr:CcdB family protein [Salaquimonas sp.]